MNKEEQKKYKESLERERAEIENQLKAVPLIENMGDDVEGNEDLSEEADEAEQLVNNAAVRQPLEERLRAITEALDKLNQ